MNEAFVGLRPLLQVSAKQDARSIAPWIALISALSVSSLLAYAFVFTEQASRQTLAATIGTNPAFGLLFGPARDLSTADGFNVWRSQALGGFFAGLMAILIVIRNSRAEEDSGRAELIASTVVGRHARLGAAVGLAWLASIALGVVAAAATILFGGDVTGSIALAATFTASGFVFAAVAAITAQIASLAQTASAMAIATLGAAYLVRGYADASPEAAWAIWVTPLGWNQEVRPVTENNWWLLGASLLLASALLVVANILLARRDFGQGLVPTSPGPARGGFVTSVWGLALRLQRGSVIAWSTAFIILGGVFGYLASSMGDVVAQNPVIAGFLAATGASEEGLVFEFLLMLLRLLAIIAAVFGVGVMMAVYREETEDRVEPLLAGALPRATFYASHVLIALIGPAIVLVVAGAVIGLVAAAAGAPGKTGDLALQALAEVPAVWLLIGLSIATVGANPRVRMAAWLAIVATFVLTILGPMLNLWDWILGISPLRHVPNVTAASPNYLPLLPISLIFVALVVVGFAGFHRRDVPQ